MLLKDELKAPTPNIGPLHTEVQTFRQGPSTFEIHLPPATPERRAARREFAKVIGIDTDDRWWTDQAHSIERDAAVDAYERGGPLWLQAYDRNFVMRLPYGLRSQMVEDVLESSPGDAEALGRDILKDLSADGAREIAIGAQAAAQGVPPPGE